ncbi:MAG: efflux RND transporter permease subunit, partial [Spirochaetia bacterium]|nr:efflux RND transporter permease subunit [Spirochaetia bacterium]
MLGGQNHRGTAAGEKRNKNKGITDFMGKKQALFFLMILSLIFLFTLRKMRLGFLPEIDERIITVKIELKGAFENEIEKLVSKLEEPLSLISSVENIISVSELEKGIIYLYFTEKCNMDRAYISVRDCVNRIYSAFPENAQRPSLGRNSGSGFPVFIASFDKKLFSRGKVLEQEFESIEGAGEIETAGGKTMEIGIKINSDAAMNSSLMPDDGRFKIASSNVGRTITPLGMVPVKVDCRIKSRNDIADIFLNFPLGIKDAGEICYQPAKSESEGRINGKDSIILYAMKTENANTIRLCRKLVKKTAQIGGSVIFSRGGEIEKSLSETAASVFTGIIFVVLTTFIFLKDPYLSFLAAANPVFSAISAASAAVWFDFEINIISLAGIAICAGLSIDNAIIFIESYEKSISGKISVIKKLFNPLLFSALTTMAVFFPLFFAPDKIKTIYSPLALITAAGLCGSFIFTFVFIPPFLPEKKNPITATSNTSNKIIKNPFFFSYRHKKHIIPFFIILAALDFLIISNHDFIFFSWNEGKNISFTLEYESGINFNYVKNSAGIMEKELLASGCKDVTVRYETGKAQFNIKLNSPKERDYIKKRIIDIGSKIDSAYCYFPENLQSRYSYDIDIYGDDIFKIAFAAKNISETIKKNNPESEIIYHFKAPVPGYNIIIDTAKCSFVSVSPEEVFAFLYMALTSPVISKYYENGVETDIRCGIAASDEKGIEQIMDMTVKSKSGNLISIKNIASYKRDDAAGRIYHKNRQRYLSISVKKVEIKAIDKILNNTFFEEGYRAEGGSEYKKIKNSEKAVFQLSCVSLLFIYIVLAVYFESVYLPALNLTQIPSTLFIPLI